MTDENHTLEDEHAGLMLLEEAEAGLRQILAGERVSAADLMRALTHPADVEGAG